MGSYIVWGEDIGTNEELRNAIRGIPERRQTELLRQRARVCFDVSACVCVPFFCCYSSVFGCVCFSPLFPFYPVLST